MFIQYHAMICSVSFSYYTLFRAFNYVTCFMLVAFLGLGLMTCSVVGLYHALFKGFNHIKFWTSIILDSRV